MKKIAGCSILALLSTVILISSAASQELALNTGRQQKTFTAQEAKDPSGEICSIESINKKVLKNFHRSFGEKRNAVWFKADQGFVVRFKEQNRNTNVYLSSNGAIKGKIDYYFENELPKDVRHIVKSNFYDYAITHVSEVHKNDVVCYFITIEDQARVKTIKLIGEDYTVLEELVKR